MFRFAASRIAMAIPTLLIVAVSVFVLIRLIPGDPAQLLLGDLATPASLAELRARLGLDRSLPAQFGIWFGHVLQGDLGTSINSGQDVLSLVTDRFLISGRIVLVAVALAAMVAVPAGMIAAWKQNRAPDLLLVGTATLLVSIPTFWLGLLLLLLFGLKLGWLPVVGYVGIAEDWKNGLLYLVLPVLTLFLHEIGVLMRMARASTLEVLRLDYITHARAKGLSERAVLMRHAFKNAFGPTWTLIGLVLGNLLGGIAVVETVFTIPGLGRLLVDAIFARDYPVIQGCLLFVAVIYVVVNLVIDLCYPFFDPRVAVE
ncbi:MULTISPECIES: ABC transporter permease [Variovorax]|jgi:peptide/nickel transport system permease protein|uniref:ABC transporter permease n=1 Tax=Variovorax TaxID=34072 RepID=UPI00089B246F|nr:MULTISPECIES: ABC transporter permease [Variovorax]MDQ0080610.1 peptide/nickel transport system permease protein [Variovorax boronicumulans]SDX60239.1 peptide/nickel transport system permease protein [Variovorax sp. YR634]SDY73350.1 peptide/nickel transport system permease protein [Variovorax sp. YR266]SES93778.1 peptide/nickel transport system permease protein [Variovorax sp. OV084]SOD28200.1 peptide/nickel transport system permease protein [Variovorax sp. YR752]